MRHALFIGRYQPLHDGHKALIQKVLDEGKPVLVALMDTEIDDANPYTIEQRKAMFRQAFGDKVQIMVIPPIAEVCYGRNVGYWVRRIFLDPATEAISATDKRSGTPAPEASEFADPHFVETWNRMAAKVHQLAVDQGFWSDGDKRDPCWPIALAHSELSEALECMRFGNPPDKNIAQMSGAEVQLSDVLGILLDMSAGYGFKLAEALQHKMQFNTGRGHLHGKEF